MVLVKKTQCTEQSDIFFMNDFLQSSTVEQTIDTLGLTNAYSAISFVASCAPTNIRAISVSTQGIRITFIIPRNRALIKICKVIE